MKIVPNDATPQMLDAWSEAEFGMVPDYAACYRAMLAAAPTLDDAAVDDLCRAMWPESHWGSHWDARADSPETQSQRIVRRQRDEDRARMRAFLAAIHEPTP